MAVFAAQPVVGTGTPTGTRAPQPSQRPGTMPSVVLGMPITECSDPTLVDLIWGIESDTPLRTEDEVFDQFVLALGFQWRGSRIRAASERALLQMARVGHGQQ